MDQRVRVKKERNVDIEPSRHVSEPVDTQETNMTSQAEEEESEEDMSEEEEDLMLEDMDVEDIRERWEVAQIRKNRYAGVSHLRLPSLLLMFRKSEMLESLDQ